MGMIDEYKKKYSNIMNVLFMIAIPVAIGLFIKADSIIYIIGGREYLQGSDALRILACSLLFAIGACVFSHSVLIPYNMEKVYMRVTWCSALINIILNFILIPAYGIEAAAATTLVSEIIMFVVTFSFSNKKMTFSLDIKNVRSVLIGSLLVLTICVIVRQIMHNYVSDIIVSILFSIIAYGGALILLRNPFLFRLFSMAKKKQ